jgi:hypothetical protein
MQVENFQLIKRIDFGQVWYETLSADEPLRGQYIREFHHVDDPEAIMRLYHRGGLLGKYSAENFVRILQETPHDLSDSEKSAVMTVIGAASEADWFKTEAIRTIAWNGKTVLELQGLWIADQGGFLALYLCSEQAIQIIHEFHYFAPQSKFEKYLPDARRVLESVQWR